MNIQHISAITLAVRDMTSSVEFYTTLGLELLYGGEGASFSSLRAGDGFINLIRSPSPPDDWWGRVILRVRDADALYERLREAGLEPDRPRNADWGERFFHLRDPDGHELSLAQLLEAD